jgi:hypothetical protein
MTDVLDALDETAHHHKPRLFAIYGAFDDPDDPSPEFLGWGMEFPNLDQAVLYEPGPGPGMLGSDIYYSNSAEKMLKRYDRLGTARLVWFDAEP